MPPKDYEDNLDISEFESFKGAIIVMGCIVACGIILWMGLPR